MTDAVGLANTQRLKNIYDQHWQARDYTTNALIVRLHGVPEFVCSSIVDADFDFSGKELAPPAPPTHVCFTTHAAPDGGIAVWSWVGKNPTADQLRASFQALPTDEQPAAVLRYALEFLDMLYFSPDWWESRDTATQTAVIQRMTAHVQPYYRRTSAALLHDDVRATQIEHATCELKCG